MPHFEPALRNAQVAEASGMFGDIAGGPDVGLGLIVHRSQREATFDLNLDGLCPI
jgi:hypothetical protein